MRAPRAISRSAAAAVALGLLAVAAADFPAGASPPRAVPPDEYADRVCSSTGAWFEEIVDLSGEFGDDLSSATDTDEQKDLTLDFLDTAIDLTSGWLEELEDAGTPDVDGGKSIAKAYRRGARAGRKVLRDAAEEAADLPTSDDDEFEEQLDEIGSSIDAGLDEVGEALDEAEEEADEEYREALTDEPACEELREAVGDVTAAAAGAPVKEVSAKEVSVEKWVKSLCSSFARWAEDLAAARTDPDLASPDLETRRDALVDSLEAQTDATTVLLKRFKKAGTPDIDDGKKIAATFRQAYERARDASADAANAAEEISTRDAEAYEEDALAIQQQITAGAAEVGQAFDAAAEKYDTEALDAAFRAEPACTGTV